MSPQRILLVSALAAVSALPSTYAGDSHAVDDAFWAEAASLLPGFSGVPTAPGPSDQNGSWGPVISWPHTPVSAANLPDGKILTYSGQEPKHWPGTKTQTHWTIWDPATNAFSNDLYLDHEMFCAHLVMRTDGVLQTVGGRYTVRDSSTFDWRDNQWGRVADMSDRRWYTTSVALPDGDVFTVSGNGGPNTAERFSPETDTWQRLGGIDWKPIASADGFESQWWAYVFVAPDGRLFHFGPTEQMHWVSPDNNGSVTSAALQVPGNHYPKHAGVVMYESGKFLIAGGAEDTSGGTTRACYTVDLNTTPPTVATTGSMAYPRRFQNAIALPTGEVLIVGGNTSGKKFSDQGTILTPEIWNPATGTWRSLADMSIPRNYHSTGVLLPDGRVFSGGGGYAANKPDVAYTHTDAQLYTPPSLFRSNGDPAIRPSITSAPDAVAIGSVFEVNATPGLSRFSMIRMMATTHGLSTDQRFLNIPFSENNPGDYQLVAHPNANVMVPGYWMLFGLDENGTYSEASIIHIKETGDSAGSGLSAIYHDGITLDNPKIERTDHTVDFSYGTGSPFPSELGNDTFSTRWTGWIVPDYSETHTFYTNSDDGVRLWVNGTKIIDNWTTHAPTENSASISLTAGVPVSIALEHFEAAGGAVIQLSWSGPRTAKTIIPAKNLRTQNPLNEGIISADNRHEFFVNGKLIAIGTDWQKAVRSSFSTGERTTLAIRATDAGGAGGLIGQFKVNGETIVTSTDWKASTSAPPGWHLPGFDDSLWESATNHGAPTPNQVSGLPWDTQADWIWSSDRNADNEVFFRITLGGPQWIQVNQRVDSVGNSVSFSPPVNAPPSSTLSFQADGLPTGLSINPSSGAITGTTTQEGIFSTSLTVTDQDDSTDSTSFTWIVRLPGQGEGSFLREVWTDIPGSDLNNLLTDPDYPNNPDVTSSETEFPLGVGSADNYGTRLRGYIHAPVSGDYTFWLSTDDQGRLLLSPDETPASANLVASLDAWAPVAIWDLYPSQQSTIIPLIGGQRYYFEIIQKEGSGRDHINLAWQRPGDSGPVVVDSSYLSPFQPNRAPILDAVADQSHTVGTIISLSTTATDADDDLITFSVEGLPSGLSFNPSSGEIFGTPNTSGVSDVILTAADPSGASGTRTFTWTINPEANVSNPATTPSPAGEESNFALDVSGGTNSVYVWNFGDGSPEVYSASPEITHTFQQPGRYTITFTVIDANGSETSLTFLQNIHPPLTPDRPASSQPITIETTPSGLRVWNVNPDNNTVSVHDASNLTKLAEIPVGNAPRSIGIAPDGRLWAVNKRSSSISVIDPVTLSVETTIALPRASSPFGLVFSPTGNAAYVSLEARGEIAQLDPASGAILERLTVGDTPRHLSINHDGSLLYASRFVSPAVAGEDSATPDTSLAGGFVTRVDTANMSVAGTTRLAASTEPDSGGGGRGIPNYLGPAVLSPANDFAWVPSKQDNIKRGMLRDGRDLTHDNTVRAIASRITLSNHTEDPESRIDFDDAAVPVTGEFGPNGLYLFVALEGSREVAVVDVYGNQELFRFPTGRAPQGLALSPDGSTLFVHNFMDRSISIHDVSSLTLGGLPSSTLVGTLPAVASESLETGVFQGKQLFYDAQDDRLASQDYISCAACHNDGGHDGRVWDLTGFGEGLRNTIDLRGKGGTAHGPLHWSANFDEVQDFENQINNLSGGTGLIESGNPHPPLGIPNAGRSADLDALAAYVQSLSTFEESPSREEDGTLTPAAIRGRATFLSANCASCHSGENFTDSGFGPAHDIGTLKPSSGERLAGLLSGIDTPTLRGLNGGEPFLHDGSAPTLAAAIEAHAGNPVPADKIADLVAYLEQIESDELTAPAPASPTILIFTANPDTIEEGDSTTLSWNLVSNDTPLTSLSINGTDVLGTSTLSVAPTANTSYTLSATNAAGTVTSTVDITVTQPPASGTYAEWAVANGATGDPTQDADSDSFVEGLEYALAMSPTLGTSSASTVPGADPAINRAPRLERTTMPDGTPRFDLVFTRSVNRLADANYWLEASFDIDRDWGIIADLSGGGETNIFNILDVIVTDLGDGTEEVRAGIRGLPKVYMRLMVDGIGATVYSPPFGYLTRNIHRQDNLIAPPFVRDSVYGGTFTATVPQFSDQSASWSPNQWLSHIVHITSGPAEGAMLEITGNSATSLIFANAPQLLLDRVANATTGSYMIRKAHTLSSLFGASNEAGLLPGDPSGGDIISLVNEDSSFADYYYRSGGLGGTGWRSTADPFLDQSGQTIPPSDGFFLNHPSEDPYDLYLYGEVLLGRRIAPVRSGISILGSYTPFDRDTLSNIGLDPFFLVSPDGNNDSNLYLETPFGGLHGHYRKDDTNPGGSGWRTVFDDLSEMDSRTFEPATSWLLFRFGEAGLWERPQPFDYTE